MPIWIVFVAIASIAATALLTWVLWRINLGNLREAELARGPAMTPGDDDD